MDAALHNTRHEQFVFYPIKLKSVNLLSLSVGNHTFYFLSLVVPTCLIHVFSSCIQQGANNPSFLPPSAFSSSVLWHPSSRSLFLTRPWRIPRTARVSLKSCQDMFCCQRDAEWERIRYRPWCVPDKKQAN